MYFLLIFFLILIMPVIVMPKYMIAGSFSPHRIVVQAAIVSAGSIMIVFMAVSMTGEGIYSQMQSAVDMLSEQAAAIPQITEALGISDLGKEEQIEAFSRLYDRSARVVPITLMFIGAVIAYLEYIIISRLLSKRTNVKKMPPLREMSFPYGTAMAIMLMYVIAWIISMEETAFGDMFYVNINTLFDLVFSLQGISVVLMMFYLRRLPNIAGGVVAAVMWVTSIGRMCLVMVGIADLILGLKVRMRGSRAGKS